MLKILQVSHDLNIGGLQRVVLDLSHALKRVGQEVHVCSLRGPGVLSAEAEKKGIPVHAMPWPEKGVDRWMFLKVRRLLASGNYDVVHTHNTQAFIDGGLAALFARTPVRIHTDHARSFPDKWKYMFAERVLSMSYDKVVAVSDDTLRNLSDLEGISGKRLAVIPNGIDGGAFRARKAAVDRKELRKKLGLDRFSHVLGLGVRLEEQKGIKYLVSAMPEILRSFPQAGLVVAGGGSLLGELNSLARELGVDKNVVLLGPFPSLIDFYPLLDIFVLPSLWEGMPLCILEAMCIGLPVLATGVGGVPEFLTDGEDGILLAPRDPENIAAAVISVLGNPDKAAAMGAKASLRFDTRFDFMRMGEDYLKLYQTCFAGTAKARRKKHA